MIEIGIVKSTKNDTALVMFEHLDTEAECQVLQVSVGANQVVAMPTQGTQVVCWLERGKNLCLGSVFSAQEKMPSVQDKTLVFDKGENGGLIVIAKLQEQLAKMTARIDGIIDAINSGVAAPTDGGVALQNSIKLQLQKLQDIEDFSDITNDLIQH